MLLQSHSGCIDLLPSLPDAWPTGSISGLRARGNYGVDIRWAEGKLAEARITAGAAGICHVRYGQQTLSFEAQQGETYTLRLHNGILTSSHP